MIPNRLRFLGRMIFVDEDAFVTATEAPSANEDDGSDPGVSVGREPVLLAASDDVVDGEQSATSSPL